MSIEKNRKLMIEQIQKLKGQLNEAKIKKDSIVIPKTGVHKGDRHIVIHDFGDGTYNIMPASGLIKNKYSLGAARAKASDLKLVKEDQLNEQYRFNVLEPFTMDELIMTIKANVDPAYIDKKSIQQEFDELLEYHVAEAKKEFKFHLNGIIGMFKRQREKDLKLMAKNRKR